MTLSPELRLPAVSRLVFQATIPAGARAAAEATRLVAWIADCLVAEDMT
jgi:hypothetical protein